MTQGTLTERIAERLIRELGFELEDLGDDLKGIPPRTWLAVSHHLDSQKPATLGIIAVNGNRTMLLGAATGAMILVMRRLLSDREDEDGWDEEEPKPPVLRLVHCDRCESQQVTGPRCPRCGKTLPQLVCALPFQAEELRRKLKLGVELFGAEDLTLPHDQYRFFVLKPQRLIGKPGQVLVFEEALVVLSHRTVAGYTQLTCYTNIRRYTVGIDAQIFVIKSPEFYEFGNISDYVVSGYGIGGYLVGKGTDSTIWVSLTARSPEQAHAEHEFLLQTGEIRKHTK